MNVEDKVKWVFSSKDHEELAQRYDQWAKDYEQNLQDEFDYVGPQLAVDVFGQYISKDAKILDAGAGTGLVGQLLYQQGYHDLEAMDMSEGMLAEADKKKVYKALHQKILGEPLGLPSASFDAIISVGTFTAGHAPSNSFDELIRVTKPGGYIIFTISSVVYEKDEFPQKMATLENSHQWELIKITDKFRAHLKGEPDLYLKVWVYQVC